MHLATIRAHFIAARGFDVWRFGLFLFQFMQINVEMAFRLVHHYALGNLRPLGIIATSLVFKH